MPSHALLKFESNLLREVDRLISTHSQLNHNGRGRRGLGHITRSGVLMLCAAWELYLEEVLLESAKYLESNCDKPAKLPLPVRKELSKSVKESKHELKPLELAGDGWKVVYINHLETTITGVNTPKSNIIDPLFERFLGIKNISNEWSLGSSAIDSFVKARGDIAHRGRDAQYVTIEKLRRYKDDVSKTVVETDNGLASYLRNASHAARMPWNRRNS